MSHAETTLDLLDRSREALTSGYAASAASARYLAASLAALRAGAALVAARSATLPGAGLASGGDGPHDVWALTARVAPELTEWAQRFAAATGQRVGRRDRAGAGHRPRGRRPAARRRDLRRPRRRPPRGAVGAPAAPAGPRPLGLRAAMDGFAHLHVASGFSMRYGASMPEDLVERAAAHGQGALALTDRDGLYGAVRFATACGRAGIAPVLGVDLAVEPLVPGAGAAAPAGRHPAGCRAPPPRPRTPVRGGAIVDPRRPRVTVLARGRGGGTAPGVGLGGAVPAGHRDPPARRAGRPGHHPRPARPWSHPDGPRRVPRFSQPEAGTASRRVAERRGGSRAGCSCSSAPTPTSAGRCSPGAASGPATSSRRGRRCCPATGSPSRSSSTAAPRAPPGAGRTRRACSASPTRPASPPCSPPRCATPTPTRCAPSTSSTPPGGSSCSTRATSTGSPTPGTSPTPRRCTPPRSRSPAATAPAPTGSSR